ncbi:hypothetical protein Tco_0331993 [Tanacetum coccineum]
MRAFVVRRKGLPKIIGTLGSGSKLTTTKSARKVKPSTLTTTTSAMPIGCVTVECSNPEVDIDEIDAFLAMEVSSNFEEGIVREHEDYINRMSLLCSNSSSQSPENSHTTIESLPISTTLIEDSDPNREEIDIFSGPDDSIPPGIESDFDSEEDIIDNLLNENPTRECLTFNIEPDAPVINNVDELNEDECFDPGGGEINVEVDNSFKFVTWIFLPYLTYPEVSPLLSTTKNEDTIFDPGIFIFHFSYLEPVVFSMEVSYSKIDPNFSEDSRVWCFVPVHSSFLAFACHLLSDAIDKEAKTKMQVTLVVKPAMNTLNKLCNSIGTLSCLDQTHHSPPQEKVRKLGECGVGSGVHWWRRVEKVVVGRRRREGGEMVVDDGEREKSMVVRGGGCGRC